MASDKTTFKHIIHHMAGVCIIAPGDDVMRVVCALGLIDTIMDLADKYGFASFMSDRDIVIYLNKTKPCSE